MALRKNDPYNEMDSGHEGIRPGFLGGSGDTEEGVHGLFRKDEGTGRSRAEKRAARIEAKAAEKDAASSAAAEDLEGAEEGASSGGLWRGGDNLDETQDAEEEANGFYSGSGKDANKKKLKAKKSRLSFLKRGGPSFGILGSIVAIGGLMGGMQSLMPFAIEEMIIEKFNSIGISSTIASDAWLNTQLNYGVRIGNTITNEPENLFAFSHFQVQQFEGQGIKVIEGIGTENTSITALLYLKNNEYIPVVGSDFIQYESLVPAIKTASGLDNIGTPVQAKDALTDPAFKVPYTTASKAWRGGGSGWFDNIMSKVTEVKLSLKRNRWSRYTSNGLGAANRAFKEIADEAEKLKKLSADNGISSTTTEYMGDDGQKYSAADGYSIKKVDDTEWIYEGDSRKVKLSSSEAVSESIGSEKLSGISSVANAFAQTEAYNKISNVLNSKALAAGQKVAEVTCGVVEALTAIYTLSSAYQNLQFLNLISGFLEAVDKVKAGDGASSPINEYSNNFMTPVDTYDNTDGERTVAAASKTALQSQGLISLFSGGTINSLDASVKNVNFESLMARVNNLAGGIVNNIKTFEACGYVKIASATIDLATTIFSVVPLIGQGFKGIDVIIKIAKKVVQQTVLQTAINLIIPRVSRAFAEWTIKNVATEWFGEDLGNALYSGASKYLGGNASSGLQSAGDKESVLKYLAYKEQVIAEEAEYQRVIRDPFDISSPYTFLGNLAYSSLPLLSSNSFGAIFKGISNIMGNSLISLAPFSSAYAASNEVPSVGNCPVLESTGAVGDAFCNPYIITDMSTMSYSPVLVAEIVENIGTNNIVASTQSEYNNKIKENLDTNGNIIDGSELAKYLTYCGQRVSSLGLRDATIFGVSNSDSTLRNILGYIPIAGNIMDIIDGSEDVNNLKWATGQNCVASSESNSKWQTEYKYYQRYAENQRLLENMNPGYTSRLTAYLDSYYDRNPLDQSLEGTLARFSGMSKEQVEDTLALMEYYQFLAEYDPSERLAFVEPKETKEIKFDNDYKLAQVFYVLTNQISYNDIRNRTFAV